jgi:alanyl-tRNA synthetase
VSQSERLYYSDSFLASFSATVAEARKLPGSHSDSLWQLALDRSAFYPSSGGQPFDTGVLTATSTNGGTVDVRVEQVEEDEEGTVWHVVRQALPAGTAVRGRIDWERRFDHMQQHTGQHLLSAIFVRELHAPTVSFHLGESSSTIDLAVGQLAHHSLERVERIANEIIADDRAVTIASASREEAEAMMASGELRKLPEREGSIRLIDIADCDRNACGGTHVRSTGQIGALLLRKIEKVTRGFRVEFVCGLRAVRVARTDAAALTETSALLSTGAAELPAAVQRLLAEAKTSAQERKRLREELAAFHAAQLVAETTVAEGLRLLVREFKDRDSDYVRMLASRTAAAGASTVAIFSAREQEPTRLFLARSRDLNFDCGRTLREALAAFGLRGGGSPDLAQCEVPRQQEAALIASLGETVRRLGEHSSE